MKKRILGLVLALVLCLMLLVPSASAADIYFIAVDDSIPLTLPTTLAPYYSGGTLYVPHSVFDAAPGGVISSYNAAEQTCVLYRRGERLIFDLETDMVTDEDKNVSSCSTLYKGGILYVPLYFSLSHFELSVTTLNSNSGYPILRFTTGNEVYDDAMFIEKAENLIIHLAKQYQDANGGTQSSSKDDPNKPDNDQPNAPHTFYLAVTGASQMAGAADALEARRLRGAFFLTAQEIADNPDLVRKLYISGHHLGLTVADGTAGSEVDAALAEANAALDRLLHFKSVTVLLTDAQAGSCTSYSAFLSRKLDMKDTGPSDTAWSKLMVCGASDVSGFLAQAAESGASVRPLQETAPVPRYVPNPPAAQ